MPYRVRRRLNRLLIGMMILLMLGACAPQDEPISSQAPQGTYPVESVFREFYSILGGSKTLGYAISPLIESDNVKLQYTVGALMRYDTAAEVSQNQRFSLAPIGNDLHVSDPPIELPAQDGVTLVDGYIIYDDFVPLYNSLQGSRFAGKPLTQVHVDRKLGRIEQYFTNVGFYRLINDPPGEAHLLGYGGWKCDAYCHIDIVEGARVSPQPLLPEPFVSSLLHLGLDFAGRPMSAPYKTAEGNLEQVYQNLVLSAPLANLGGMNLRPITEKVGFPPTAPVAKVEDDRLVFYPTQPGLGHEVPKVFENYITQHGGLEMSGMPTTEVFPNKGIYRQCFTNICLDYDPGAAEADRIRPAPLGEIYLGMSPGAVPEQAATPAAQLSSYTLTAWPEQALISSNQGQVIHARVTDAEGKAPLKGEALELTILLPDGSQTTHPLPPTDAEGQSSGVLAPLSVPNGTIIPYQVCLLPASGEKQCMKDSFVIWGNR